MELLMMVYGILTVSASMVYIVMVVTQDGSTCASPTARLMSQIPCDCTLGAVLSLLDVFVMNSP
jgi:hypothetical protein